MYSIGQFALILKLSTRTLRHYDDIGLIKPSYTDPNTNYRFYEKKQISDARQIVRLKDSGLQLEEIKKLIDKKSDAEASEILKYRLEKLDEEIKNLNRMKENLKILLDSNIQSDYKGAKYSVETVVVDDVFTINKKLKIDLKFIGSEVGNLYSQINKLGLRVIGGHIVTYENIEIDSDNSEIQLSLPVEKIKEVKAPYSCIEGGKYLRVRVDSVSEKGEAHAAILDLAANNSIKLRDKPMEIYNIENGSFKVNVLYAIEE
ncbi:MerR family transcriptional regulator [Clostridium sp. YIM B02505]|uniref:MerR family transcriptional regulator n=1 Tax=Clostridium yunnanense TaxID=2800325 RepID=A0ABS1EIE8_9CLOT|nr:helix-turn-helix domain-containing protein [Clostridium yunnanense]MBK1809098.1 MerR family transcriptional regulator [Clostridium yunnanense]